VKQIMMDLEIIKEKNRIAKDIQKEVEDTTEALLPSDNVPERLQKFLMIN
jgi:hypothetical protein